MRHVTARMLAIALAWSTSGRALAGADGVPASPELPPVLHLDEALSILRTRGLDLLLAEAALHGAEGDLRAAGAVANPGLSLSYGRSFTRGSCTDLQGQPASCGLLPDAQYGVGISDQGAIADALSGKRALRADVARAAREAARASRDDARRSLEGQVRLSFVQVVIAKEAARFQGEVAAGAEQTRQLTQARLDAGAISEADLARVEVAALEAEQAHARARQSLREAKGTLAFLLGVRGPPPAFDVEAPDLLRAPGARLGAAGLEALLERARSERPDLAAAARQRERAGAALALARRQRFPEVQLSVSYAQQGTTSAAVTPPTVTAGLTLPLPVLYQRQGEIQRAEADATAQALSAAKVEAQVASEVSLAWADAEASTARARRMEESLLARAGRARDLVEVQYRKGAASLLDLLDAQRTFISTRLEYLDALAAAWGGVFRLQQAIGGGPP